MEVQHSLGASAFMSKGNSQWWRRCLPRHTCCLRTMCQNACVCVCSDGKQKQELVWLHSKAGTSAGAFPIESAPSAPPWGGVFCLISFGMQHRGCGTHSVSADGLMHPVQEPNRLTMGALAQHHLLFAEQCRIFMSGNVILNRLIPDQ